MVLQHFAFVVLIIGYFVLVNLTFAKSRAVETHFKKRRFFMFFFKKPKNPEKLGF